MVGDGYRATEIRDRETQGRFTPSPQLRLEALTTSPPLTTSSLPRAVTSWPRSITTCCYILNSVNTDQLFNEDCCYLSVIVTEYVECDYNWKRRSMPRRMRSLPFKVKPSNETQNRVWLQRSNNVATKIFQRLTTRKPMHGELRRPSSYTTTTYGSSLRVRRLQKLPFSPTVAESWNASPARTNSFFITLDTASRRTATTTSPLTTPT